MAVSLVDLIVNRLGLHFRRAAFSCLAFAEAFAFTPHDRARTVSRHVRHDRENLTTTRCLLLQTALSVRSTVR